MSVFSKRFLIVFCQPLFKKLCYVTKSMHKILNFFVMISNISLPKVHLTGNQNTTATVAVFHTLITDSLVLSQQHNNSSFKAYYKVLHNYN